MLEQNHKSLGKGRDIARAAGAGQSNCAMRSADLRGIQIAEAIDLSGTKKSKVHTARLQKAHDAKHVEALRCAENVRRVGHGVDQLWRGSRADDRSEEHT